MAQGTLSIALSEAFLHVSLVCYVYPLHPVHLLHFRCLWCADLMDGLQAPNLLPHTSVRFGMQWVYLWVVIVAVWVWV